LEHTCALLPDLAVWFRKSTHDGLLTRPKSTWRVTEAQQLWFLQGVNAVIICNRTAGFV
jgi:hypothetical protein